MSRRQSWTVVALTLGLLIIAQPVVGSQEDTRVVDAFKKCVERYFTLLAAKDSSLPIFFEKIASEDFRCQRGEILYDKKAWLDFLHEYLGDNDTISIQYEYEMRLVKTPRPDQIVFHLTVTEIRLWNDVNGMFGAANHILEYREPFEMDVALVLEKGEWRWKRMTFYGIGKREFEQSTK